MFTMFTGATFSASITEGQTVNYTHYSQKNLTEDVRQGLLCLCDRAPVSKKGSYNVGIVVLR